jgi:hypothetical protein
MFIVLLFLTLPNYSQIDLEKCSVTIKENFNPRVLEFSSNYLLMHAYNINTLYLLKDKKTIIYPTEGYGVINAIIDKEEEYVIISNYHKTVDIHSIKKDTLEKSIDLKNAKAYAICKKNDKIYCGLSNGEILISSILTSDEKRLDAHKDIIRDLKISDNLLFSVSHDGFLKKWSVEDNLIIESINLKKVLTKLAVSPDKSLIAVGRIDGSVVLLDKNFKIIKVFKPNNSIITQIKFSGNHTFITSSFDKRIVSVDISNGTMIELYKSNDYITNFDIREKQFIYSARNGTIKYYNKNCLTTKK